MRRESIASDKLELEEAKHSSSIQMDHVQRLDQMGVIRQTTLLVSIRSRLQKFN